MMPKIWLVKARLDGNPKLRWEILGIGIMHLGTERYMVSSKDAAEKVAQDLWRE